MNKTCFAIRLLIWMSAILLLSACQMPPTQQVDAGPSIQGEVVWGTQPVVGAVVELRDGAWASDSATVLRQTTADASGIFTMTAAPVGEYGLVARWPDGSANTAAVTPVQVADEDLTDVTVWLTREIGLLEPISGATVDGAPILRWQPLEAASRYRIMVIDAGTTALLVDEQTEATEFAVTQTLIPGQTYQWLAQGVDAEGILLGEVESTFTVADSSQTVTPVADVTGALHISLDTGTIASGLESEMIAAVPATGDAPAWAVLPAYTIVTLQGYPIDNHLMQPQIFIYPVEALIQVNEGAGQRVESLQTLIQSPQEVPSMPFLPLYNAAQVMHTHLQYLDFENGQGMRYLTQFNQGVVPINNYNLIYTYQGLTDDGKYYVAAVLPVSHPSLPTDGRVTGNEPAEFMGDFTTYLANVVSALNLEAATSFTPNLTQLDAMMSSLDVH